MRAPTSRAHYRRGDSAVNGMGAFVQKQLPPGWLELENKLIRPTNLKIR